MDRNFAKFKKRVWSFILIKCLAAGLAAALLAVVATLLPCRLFGIALGWLYILIGLGGFAVGFGVALLFLRTSDKKIALLLDDKLDLKQRVQTAYELGGEDGVMARLQREDTSKELGRTPAEKLPFVRKAALIICAAVFAVGAASVPVINAVVPFGVISASGEEKTDDPPREITDWEWAALDELINYVRASKKLDAYTRVGMLGSLEGLRSVLLDGVSQNSLQSFVYNTVNGIRNVVKEDSERDGVSDEQIALNAEEETYVINKLYEIFDLQANGAATEDGSGENDDGDENGDSDDDGVRGEGTLGINDTPFFDPEKGYVKCGDVRDEYYAQVQAALQDGTLSAEEWAYIMATYFADLSGND